MMTFLCLFLSVFAWSNQPENWDLANKITDRHEFYKDNEIVIKPKDSWQILFAVQYPSSQLQNVKDCVYYRVPGLELGSLRIKSTTANDDCEKYVFKTPDKEWKGIKALQFSIKDGILNLSMTFEHYKGETWLVKLKAPALKPKARLLMSSAEFKGPKILLLGKNVLTNQVLTETAKGKPCHEISDDCQELSSSRCNQCSHGWYEIPNGCVQGPKFCGVQECGHKNQPACRRGMKWQRKQVKYDCRTDSSFAYCINGLMVQCQGALAHCR